MRLGGGAGGPVDADTEGALVGRPQHARHVLHETVLADEQDFQLHREMGRDRPGQGFAIGEVGHIDVDTRREQRIEARAAEEADGGALRGVDGLEFDVGVEAERLGEGGVELFERLLRRGDAFDDGAVGGDQRRD